MYLKNKICTNFNLNCMFKQKKVHPSYYYYESDNSEPTKIKHKYLNKSNLKKLPRLSTNSRLEPLKEQYLSHTSIVYQNKNQIHQNKNQIHQNKNQINYYHSKPMKKGIFKFFNNKVSNQNTDINKETDINHNHSSHSVNNNPSQKQNFTIDKISNTDFKKYKKVNPNLESFYPTEDADLNNDVFASDDEDNNFIITSTENNPKENNFEEGLNNQPIAGNQNLEDNQHTEDNQYKINLKYKYQLLGTRIKESNNIRELKSIMKDIEKREKKIELLKEKKNKLNESYQSSKDNLNNINNLNNEFRGKYKSKIPIKKVDTEDKILKKEQELKDKAEHLEKREQEILYQEFTQYLQNKKKQNVESNNSFRFPKINNKYEAEYIRLTNLCDFYKYQQPSNTFFRMYDDLRVEYYRKYRHRMYDFYMFNRDNSLYKK